MSNHITSVLITGSSGTVGTALAERLLKEGYVVHGADIAPNPWSDAVDERTTLVDLRDDDEVARLPTEVDMIVHLSAHARVHQLVERPELAMENIEMTFNVLEFARENEIGNVLFASSREVYGNNERIIYDETATNTDASESPYTASKVSGEAMVKSFGECYGMRTCIVRFSNVYGRYDVSDRVVPLFIAESTRGRDLTVYGSEKVLDFTYLDDCVGGTFRVIDQYPKVRQTTLNIASGRGSSLVELAELVNDRTPQESNIIVEPSRTGEVSRYIADISRAERILGYSPEYTLSDGLAETIDWYLDRPEVLDNLRERRERSNRMTND